MGGGGGGCPAKPCTRLVAYFHCWFLAAADGWSLAGRDPANRHVSFPSTLGRAEKITVWGGCERRGVGVGVVVWGRWIGEGGGGNRRQRGGGGGTASLNVAPELTTDNPILPG